MFYQKIENNTVILKKSTFLKEKHFIQKNKIHSHKKKNMGTLKKHPSSTKSAEKILKCKKSKIKNSKLIKVEFIICREFRKKKN